MLNWKRRGRNQPWPDCQNCPCICLENIEKCTVKQLGSAVAQLVEALRYKPEGRGFDSRWCLWNSGTTMALRSTQPLTQMSKGKAVPLQAWSGPEGSRKLRFLDFMTTAQDGGKVFSITHRLPLPPGNAPHFCQRLSRPQGHSAIGRILCQWKIPVTPFGIEPANFWFVAQHLNHCGTAVPNRNEYREYFLRGKSSWCVGLTILPPSCADCLQIWEPQSPGTLRACPGQ